MILVAAPVNDAKDNVKFVTDANLFRMFPLVKEITAISLEGRTKTGKIVIFFRFFFFLLLKKATSCLRCGVIEMLKRVARVSWSPRHHLGSLRSRFCTPTVWCSFYGLLKVFI